MTDFSSLASRALQEIRRHEDEFKKFEKVEDRIEFVREKLSKTGPELAAAVRKWRKEPQFQSDCSKSQELREKGDKLYLNKEAAKAAQFYRYQNFNCCIIFELKLYLERHSLVFLESCGRRRIREKNLDRFLGIFQLQILQ